MEKVKIVSDHIHNDIDYKIIALCIVSSIAFHYLITNFGLILGPAENANYVMESIFIISPLIAGIIALIIARFYRLSKVFGRSYISLSVGYFCSTVAETIFTIQHDLLKIDPYPSIADPFYAGLNSFLILYVIINTQFFAKTIESENGKMRGYVEIRPLLLFISVFCVIVFSYILISVLNTNLSLNFEFFYGLFFVALGGVTLSFLLYAVILFKKSALGKSWTILLIAFIAIIIGDIWYYYLEIFDNYTLSHPVNIFWYAGYWIQIYALYKHKKVT